MQLSKPARKEVNYRKFNLDDKKCQSTVCSDKNCQDNKCDNMWPVTSEMDMWSVEPASYKKICHDKNCQSTRCFKKMCPVRPVWNDKNC